MCSCNRFHLDQLDINYTYAYTCHGCRYDVEHKVFALMCSVCKYNLIGFAGEYFASIDCFCIVKEKDNVCLYSKRFRCWIKSWHNQGCLKEKVVPSEFKFVEIDKYLVIDVKTDLFFFYFCKETNEIMVRIDALDWGEFFTGKETMWLNL